MGAHHPDKVTAPVHRARGPEPRGAGRPVGGANGNGNGGDGMKAHGSKKQLLHKWQGNDTVSVHDGGGGEVRQDDAAMSLDEEIYSIISKPTSHSGSPPGPSHQVTSPKIDRVGAADSGAVVKPMPRRRRPKLLVFDSSGTPAAAQRMLPIQGTVKRGRPRKRAQFVSTDIKPVAPADASECMRQEIERIQSTASTRMHIKMNLRGRRKLENWLNTAHTEDALKLAIPKLAVDMRLLSGDETVRRVAISSMPNADLRIVEALKLRSDTKEGTSAWNFITGKRSSHGNGRDKTVVRLLPMPPPPVPQPTVRSMQAVVRERTLVRPPQRTIPTSTTTPKPIPVQQIPVPSPNLLIAGVPPNGAAEFGTGSAGPARVVPHGAGIGNTNAIPSSSNPIPPRPPAVPTTSPSVLKGDEEIPAPATTTPEMNSIPAVDRQVPGTPLTEIPPPPNASQLHLIRFAISQKR